MTRCISLFGIWINNAIHRNCFVNTISGYFRQLGYQTQDDADCRPRFDNTIVVGRNQDNIFRAINALLVTRDACKSRIHDRRDYCDFRFVPWFLALAVNLCHGRDIITEMCTISTLNGQFCVNVSSAFLSWARIVAWLTLLPCRECIQNDGIMQCTDGCSFLDQTDSDTASDTSVACDRKHATSRPHPITRESVLSCQPVNKGRSCKQDCHARVTDREFGYRLLQ